MLKKFKMEDCKSVSTPMVTSCKLSMDDESLDVYHTMRRSLIGISLYVTTIIPDVLQVVGIVEIFQFAPKEA